MAGGYSLCDAESSNPVLCDNREEWDGMGGGKEVQEGGSVQFSRSVMADSLRPHEPQHARPPCPSPTPRVDSNSRPSSQ